MSDNLFLFFSWMFLVSLALGAAGLLDRFLWRRGSCRCADCGMVFPIRRLSRHQCRSHVCRDEWGQIQS